MKIADLRQEYLRAALTENDVDPDPLQQFERWLHEAIKAQLPEPTAMTLTSVGTDGRPSARIVLLKALDARGLMFFTNYESRKAIELAENPRAALVFYWSDLKRQVRVQGEVTRASRDESEAYFRTRPPASQYSAAASPQSRPIADRATLEAAVAEIAAQYGDREVPLPDHWGGYRLSPIAMEFWQGRPYRLHDRLRYERHPSGEWSLTRLAP